MKKERKVRKEGRIFIIYFPCMTNLCHIFFTIYIVCYIVCYCHETTKCLVNLVILPPRSSLCKFLHLEEPFSLKWPEETSPYKDSTGCEESDSKNRNNYINIKEPKSVLTCAVKQLLLLLTAFLPHFYICCLA